MTSMTTLPSTGTPRDAYGPAAALASQHSEGWAPCCFRPLDNERRADQPTWILMAVAALVKESGEVGLLDEMVP